MKDIKQGDVFIKDIDYDGIIGMVIANLIDGRAHIRIYNNVDDEWNVEISKIEVIRQVLEEEGWKYVGNYEKTARLC